MQYNPREQAKTDKENNIRSRLWPRSQSSGVAHISDGTGLARVDNHAHKNARDSREVGEKENGIVIQSREEERDVACVWRMPFVGWLEP